MTAVIVCLSCFHSFSSDEEKKLVEEVFNNAIDCLSDEDKKLPQVSAALPSQTPGVLLSRNHSESTRGAAFT